MAASGEVGWPPLGNSRWPLTGGPCKGTLQLTAKVKQGKKIENPVIGRASFDLSPGSARTLAVKISNAQAKLLLAQGKTLAAQLVGTGVQGRTVKLRGAKHRR